MAEIIVENSNIQGIGEVQIADEVIAIIAGTSALEIDGVVSTTSLTGDIAEKFGVKNFSKGVKVTVEGIKVSIDLNIMIKFGFPIHKVCYDVQKKVKTSIETMTGLEVTIVNVNVCGLNFDKEKDKQRSRDKNQKNELE